MSRRPFPADTVRPLYRVARRVSVRENSDGERLCLGRDMESVDALIKGIQEYKGGVVLVSHDARLIASTGCELWVCEGAGRVSERQTRDKREPL